VGELRQLFHDIDPAPFRERDLDPDAEEYIVESAREAPRAARLALQVHLDRDPGPEEEAGLLRDAVHAYFAHREVVSRRELRELFRRGRISLLIGLATLTAFILLSDQVGQALQGSRLGLPVRESLLIGGWVAMWRPLEIFLYDWWPIWTRGKLLRRLAAMPVRITYLGAVPTEAWRHDWPAAGPRGGEGGAPPHAAHDHGQVFTPPGR
jgi:hypothetical protein